MSETIILDRDYGYSEYDLSWGVDGGTIDATAATWIVANSRNDNPVEGYGADTGDLPINRYPLQVRDADGLTFLGGTIYGEVPLGSDWTYTYRDDYPDGESANSAAIRIDDSSDATIDGWRITRPWDAIRITGDSDDFTISNVWVSQSRDDAIENDDVLSGTIRDSLFEDVFSGISLGDSKAPDGDDNIVTLDNILLKSGSYLYKGEVTHASPFKMDKDEDVSPRLRILDSVIAIEDVDHAGQERLQIAWDKTIESRDNVFLNLSDDPLPDDYPRPGEGWTILEGQEARDYWEAVAAEFKKDFNDGSDPEPDPEPEPEPEPDPTPDPTPDPEPEPTPIGLNVIFGTDSSETLEGMDSADIFRTGGGEKDTIYGLGGADTLVFGAEANDGVRTMERFKDFDISEDAIVLEQGAQIEWIRERDDRLSVKIEGDGDRLYLYGDDLSAEDVNFVYVSDDWIA